MTRNNLADHLSWLLQNVELASPLGPPLPQAGNTLDSQPSGTSLLQAQRTTARPPPRPFPREGTIPSSNSRPDVTASTYARTPYDSSSEVVVRDGEMARLTSSSKSKKPSLVVKQQQQPLTPVSTTGGVGRLQQAYSASLDNEHATIAKRGRATPAQAYPILQQHTPAFSGDGIPGSDEEFESVDLTGESDPWSSSPPKEVMLWRPDYAARSEPLSTRGKKRKSNEISKRAARTEEIDDEFPDVYDLVDANVDLDLVSPMRTGPRHSDEIPQKVLTHDEASRSQHIATKSLGRTEMLTRKSSQTTSTDSPSAAEEGQNERISSKPTHEQINTPSPKDAQTTPKARDTAIREFARQTSRKHRSSLVIQDSEDEFETPQSTSRNTSFVTCPSKASSQKGGSKRPLSDSTKPEDGPGAAETPSKRRQTGITRQRSPHSKVQQTFGEEAGMEIDIHENDKQPSAWQGRDPVHSSETDGTTLVMDLFLGNPSVIEKKQRIVEEALQKNTAVYMRSFREKWPLSRREQVKVDKQPLLKEKRALQIVVGAHKTYSALDAEREALLDVVAKAYVDGHSMDAEEATLDEIGQKIQDQERVLRHGLAEAGITVDSFEELSNVTPEEVRPEPHVVLSTQPQQFTSPSLSKESTFLPECNSQVILQTQVSHQHHQVSSSFRNPVAKQVDPILQPQSPPFPRQPRGSATKTHNVYTASADLPELQYEDDALFDDNAHVPDHGNLQSGQISGFTSNRSVYRTKSPVKLQNTRRIDPYDDFSDDIEMLRAAEDFEQRQSSGEGAKKLTARPVFAETSGNATTVPPRARSASRKAPSSQPKAAIPPELMRYPWSQDVRRALKDRFRMSGFRHNQLEAINATLDGKDAFVLMPTGGGKSLCYQLPAVINSGKTHGVTIVISPLLSLMQDQVDHLKALNITASPFNGEMTKDARNHVLDLFRKPNPEHFVQLLYVTPEMINKSRTFINGLENLHKNKKLARLVIDEAHCVSQWGHDFRPDYKALGEVRAQFPDVPVMALTATATPNVIVDIKHNLRIDECQVFSQSFNRPNLYYDIRQKEKGVIDSIGEMISSRYPNQTGIVYTLSRKSAEQIAQKLRDNHNIAAHHYHASIETAEKAQVQRDWQQGRIKVVVATIAFGMGIDKADVRFVIHHYLPKSLEGYYQETGRAGRDGKPSDCYLYFSYGDIKSLRNLIADSDGSDAQKDRQRDMLNRVVNFCENKRDCRRAEILRYFGEKFEKADCHKTCDNCKNGGSFGLEDFTEYAVAALRIIKVYRRMTMVQCGEILLGKKKPDYDSLAEYHGIAKKLKKNAVHMMIYRLLAEDALEEENKVNKRVGIAIQYFSLGHTATEFLSGRRKLQVVSKVGGDAGAAPVVAAPKRKTKMTKELPPSTNVSSPVRGLTRKRKGKALLLDQEDEESEEEPQGPLHANGYEKDNFVVSDIDDLSDDGFAPLRRPPAQRRQRTLEELGGPIARDSLTREASVNAIHAEIVPSFVDEAKRLEEQLRNEKGLRRAIFTERHFREMITRWTISTEQMRRIPDINVDNVAKFGAKFLPLVGSFQAQYREMMGGEAADASHAGPSTSAAQEIVDLISSDDDSFDDDDDEKERLESSKYFSAAPAGPNREVQQWHNQLADLNSQPQPSHGGGGSKNNTWRGGKKSLGKRVGSGSRGGGGYRGRSGGGAVTKRRASTSRKASSTSSSSKSGRGGKGGGRGGASGGSGIGMMPL